MAFGDVSNNLVNKSILAASDYDVDTNDAVDLEAGGTNADLSSEDGIVKVSGGVTSILETGITGAELEELSDGSETTKHSHAQVELDYDDISGNDAATDVTGAELEELSDGSETTKHSHGPYSSAATIHTGRRESFVGNNGLSQSFPSFVKYEQSGNIAGTRTSDTIFTRTSGTWVVDALVGQFVYSHKTSVYYTGTWSKILSNTTTAITIDPNYGTGVLHTACDYAKTCPWTPIQKTYAHGKGAGAFIGGCYDGESVWLTPYGSTDLIKMNPSDGSMTGYAHGEGGNAFADAVFDGENIWLIPFTAANLIKVNPADGSMTKYATGVDSAAKFRSAVFDGKDLWIVPNYAAYVIKWDIATGEKTTYNHGKGTAAFHGGIFDGENIWLIPYDSSDLVKVDPSDGTMTSYPHGQGGHAFGSAVFDGKYIWMVPYYSNNVVRLDPTDASMVEYPHLQGDKAFAGSVWDGESVWMIPFHGFYLIKVNPLDGTMTNHDHGCGDDAFHGGIFDGNTIWMVPQSSDNVVGFTPPRFGGQPKPKSLVGIERSADPPEPAEGEFVLWMSDGSGYGEDGDFCIATNVGGVTKKTTLFDFAWSGNDTW